MRFEVGDKVLVRNDLEVGRLYDGVGFAVSMANYLGKVLTIKEVKKNSRYSSTIVFCQRHLCLISGHSCPVLIHLKR